MLLKHAACTVFYFRAEQKNCAATRLEATLENCNLFSAPPKKTASQINFFAFAPQRHCIKDKKTRIKIRVFGEIRLVSLGQNFPFVFLDALEHRHAV